MSIFENLFLSYILFISFNNLKIRLAIADMTHKLHTPTMQFVL